MLRVHCPDRAVKLVILSCSAHRYKFSNCCAPTFNSSVKGWLLKVARNYTQITVHALCIIKYGQMLGTECHPSPQFENW